LRQSLVVAQVAVSVVLLMAAGLFVRSVHALRSIDPGVGGAPVALLVLGAPAGRTPDEHRQRLDQLVARLGALPDVRGVGRTSNMHLNLLSFVTTTVNVDGVPAPKGEAGYTIDEVSIDSGFFGAVGMRVLHGRNFVAADADTSHRVAIVNEAFVRKFWPGEDGVGRRVRWDDGTELEIVGVVNTARIRTLAEAPTPVIYRPLRDNAVVWLAVRSATSAESALERTVAIARELDPDALVYESRTLARHVGIMSLPLTLGANALGAFALVALVMASIGLYGTVSYSVAQRSREVGIRLSLGATTGGVVRLLTWDGVRLVVVGALCGVALGLLFGQALQGFLYGTSTLDPVGLASVPAVLIVVALVAAYLPARRAGRIDPVRAIKAE
jgi:predicted permease